MEAKPFRKWLKKPTFHSRSSSRSSDCIRPASPCSTVGGFNTSDAIATPANANALQADKVPSSTLQNTQLPLLLRSTRKNVKVEEKDGDGPEEDSSDKNERYGLHLISAPSADLLSTTAHSKQCPIDIVAVHGLMGDIYTTWTHENGHFWLRDSLPEQMPGARIFSYGYPAKVFRSLEQGRIDDHAAVLLEELRDARRAPEEQSRPIVFICHSMGGIVVKKAINKTVVEHERFSNIRTSTAAILFLATPHCGSDPAKMLSVCADIVNLPLLASGYSRFSGKLRSDQIKVLAPGSKTLLDISSDFKRHTANIRIFSFIEQKSTPPSTGKIVDDMSGQIFVAGEVPVPMPGCNHREVARFENKETLGYNQIVRKLNEVVAEITTKLTAILEVEDQICLHTLAFPSMNTRLTELTSQLTSQGETCKWIFKHPSFLLFESPSQNRNMLWVKGHPGTGKSTLMASLHQHYKTEVAAYTKILLSIFFHGTGSALQKSSLGMLRSLIVQLYKQNLSARQLVLTAFNQKKDLVKQEDVSWTLEELHSLFLSIIASESMSGTEVTILVDALDEAVDGGGQKAATQLMEFLYQLERMNIKEVGRTGKIKTCISCREYPVLAVSGGALQISIQDENRVDIARFVHDHLQMHVDGWEVQTQTVQTQLEKAVVDKADGVFLWVVKRLERIVTELNDGVVSFADIQKLVEGESNELFVLYENIIQREVMVKAGIMEKAASFMAWACLSERPLNLCEMRMAMSCDGCVGEGQERIEESRDFVDEDERMGRLVRSLSGGLAEVKCCAEESMPTVQLIHQTVKDFLLEGGLRALFSRSGTRFPMSEPSFPEVIGTCEQRLSRACFNYLKLGEIATFSMSYGLEPKWTVSEVEERFPFIRYAVSFCFLHAQRAEFYGISQVDLPALVNHSTDKAVSNIAEGNGISDRSLSIFEIWKVMFEAIRRLRENHLAPGLQLVHTASYCNIKSTVRHLVENQGQIGTLDGVRESPLHHAVRGGHKDLVRWLLDAGASIDGENINLSTPLELAVKNHHDDISKLLLERGADVNKQTGRYSNILEAACSAKSRPGLVEHLISSGAEVNGSGGMVGNLGTALEEAAHAGDKAAVSLLIMQGANIHAVSEHYGTALQAAVQGPRSEAGAMVELLLREDMDVNAHGGQYGNALQAAARFCTLDVIKLLLDKGANVNAHGGYYGNALQAACANIGEDEEIVKLLLSRGANVNAEGGHYGNPLQSAAASGNPAAFQLLWKKGAMPGVKGGVHQNVIEAAGVGGSQEIVQLLLDNGVDINEKGGRYGTALQAAVYYSSEPFVEYLLDQGADVNFQGGIFGNSLCAAVEARGERMIEMLLKRGADVHACTPGYLSALQLAVKKGNAKQVKALVQHGNDMDPHLRGMLRFFRK